jgi:hypothetical protein
MTQGGRADTVAGAVLVGALALATITCLARFGLPLVSAPSRDSLELLVSGDDGSITLVRVASGDGGLVDGQVTTRVARLSGGAPIVHRAQHVATRGADLGAPRGISASPDSFVPVEDGRRWRVRLGGDTLRANVDVSSRVSGASPCGVTPSRAAGALTQGDQVAMLVGPALVFETRRTGARGEGAVWVVGRDLALGVDAFAGRGPAACAAWTWNEGGGVTPVTPPAPEALARFRAKGDTLVVGEGADVWTLALDEVSRPVPLDPLVHLTWTERLLARPLAGLEAALVRAHVRVHRPDRPDVRSVAMLLVPMASSR